MKYLEIKVRSFEQNTFKNANKLQQNNLVILKNVRVISFTADVTALTWCRSESNPIIMVVLSESPICDGMTRPDAIFLILLFRAKITAGTAEFNNRDWKIGWLYNNLI